MKHTATFCATLLLAAGAQAACYTVMGPRGEIVSQTSTPPVDMAYQLHQTVPYKYGPGTTLVFGLADADCGPALDPQHELTQPVAWRDGATASVRAGARAARRDRE